MKRIILVAVTLAVTWWQGKAGIARCGTVDGGVLLPLLVYLTVLLVKGASKDLRDALSGTSPQRREISG